MPPSQCVLCGHTHQVNRGQIISSNIYRESAPRSQVSRSTGDHDEDLTQSHRQEKTNGSSAARASANLEQRVEERRRGADGAETRASLFEFLTQPEAATSM